MSSRGKENLAEAVVDLSAVPGAINVHPEELQGQANDLTPRAPTSGQPMPKPPSSVHTSHTATSIEALGVDRDNDQDLPTSLAQQWQQWFRRRVTLLMRMGFILAIPVTWLLITAALGLVAQVANVKSIDRLTHNLDLTVALADAMAFLQRERGATALYTLGMGNFSALAQQRVQTDAHVAGLLELMAGFKARGSAVAALPDFAGLEQAVAGLAQHRTLIGADAVKLGFADGIGFYSDIDAVGQRLCATVSSEDDSTRIGNALASMCLLTRVTDGIGLQRPLALFVLTRRGVELDYERYLEVYAATQEALEVFYWTATDVNRQRSAAVLDLPEVKAVVALEARVVGNASTALSDAEALVMWANFSVYQLGLQAVSDAIASDARAAEHRLDKSSHASISRQSVLTFLVVVISVALMLLLVRSTNSANRRLREEVDVRREVEKTIARFVPKQFLSLLELTNITEVKLGARVEVTVTIVFTDIVGFTALTERMTNVQAFDWILRFTEEMTPIIKKHAGFIDKYLGDGILAIFSVPQSAVHCGIEMQTSVAKINVDRAVRSQQVMGIGIGIHTGSVCAGIIGDSTRLDTTIMSESVTLAADIEGLTRPYGAQIIISEPTFQATDLQLIAHRPLGVVRLNGEASLPIYEIFQTDPLPLKQFKLRTMPEYLAGLEAYRAGRLTEALGTFGTLAAQMDAVRPCLDPCLQVKRRGAQQLVDHGIPHDWRGEEVFETK